MRIICRFTGSHRYSTETVLTQIVQPRLTWSANRRRLWEPLADAIGRHVLKRQAKFADDKPAKMQAPRARQSIDGIHREVSTGKTKTAEFWTYARDEWPRAGDAPPAA
jgi:transposase